MVLKSPINGTSIILYILTVSPAERFTLPCSEEHPIFPVLIGEYREKSRVLYKTGAISARAQSYESPDLTSTMKKSWRRRVCIKTRKLLGRNEPSIKAASSKRDLVIHRHRQFTVTEETIPLEESPSPSTTASTYGSRNWNPVPQEGVRQCPKSESYKVEISASGDKPHYETSGDTCTVITESSTMDSSCSVSTVPPRRDPSCWSAFSSIFTRDRRSSHRTP